MLFFLQIVNKAIGWLLSVKFEIKDQLTISVKLSHGLNFQNSGY